MDRILAAAGAALGVAVNGAQELLDGTDHVQNRAGPVRRAFLHHRLTTAPGEGPLADLAAETAAALTRTQDAHPLALAPAFR